ncbi:MAG: MFS transporter [Gammaproteobacteria bacterium]|nr:MFS transporter [Gammaproteobacteria bacterium]
MNSSVVFTTLAMLAVLTTASMSVFTVAVLAPEAAPALGLDPKLIGPFTSIVYFFAALVGAATGGLIARYGAIRICQTTMLAAAVAMLLIAAGNPLAALIAAVFLGYNYGPFNPASAHILSGLATPRWQPFVFSLKQTGVPLGGALAGALVPLLVVTFGWRGAAVWVGVTGVIVALLLQPLRTNFDNDLTPVTLTRMVNVWAPVRRVMTEPVLRRYTLAAFAYAGCQLSAGAFLVVYLTESHGMALTLAGLVLAAMQIGGFVGRLIWGALSGRYVTPRGMLAGLGIMAAACLAITASMEPDWPRWLVLVISILLGMSTFGWNGIMLSEIATHSPPGLAADTTAGMQFVMFGGIVIFPVSFGVLAAGAGYPAAFLLLALLGIWGALLLWRMPADAADEARSR